MHCQMGLILQYIIFGKFGGMKSLGNLKLQVAPVLLDVDFKKRI